MKKSQANDILDRIRAGQSLSLAITNSALQATGDLSRLRPLERAFGEELCADGDESGFNRPCQIHGEVLRERDARVGWSRYLDSRENQGVTQ